MARALGVGPVWGPLALSVAVLSFLRASAQVYNPQILDFSFLGDAYRDVTADIIFGTVKFRAQVEVEKLQVMETYVAATLAQVCPTQTKVIVRAYQIIESYRNVDIDVHSEYFLLPSNRDSAQCKAGLVDSPSASSSFRQILEWRITRDGTAGPGWDASTWGVFFGDPVVRRIVVRYPERLPVPVLSLTSPGPLDPFAGQGYTFGNTNARNTSGVGVDDPNCNYALSACVCATTSSCAWLPWEGTSRCIGLSGPPTNIPCADCSLQAKCSQNQVQICDLNREPCACALSPSSCRWDLSTMSCLPKNGVSTPCTACSRQDHCDSPRVLTVIPGQASTFGISGHRELTITFDRTVTLPGVMDGVSFKCANDPPTVVSPSLLRINDKVLTIQLSSFPSLQEARCHLVLGEGVVRDLGGLSFRGTPADWYLFRLQDTTPPTVAEFEPANGAEGIAPGASATIVFSEPVSLTGTCEVSLWSHGVLVTSFTLNSPSVTLDAERKRLTVAVGPHLQNSNTYSLKLPAGCTRDDTGNLFAGLNEGVYFFHMQTNTYSRSVEEDSWKLILGAALGGVAGLVVLISCVVLWCRMRSARQDFAKRLADSATRARRWSASSLEGIWTEFGNYRPRRFSFDSFAMSGWSGSAKPQAEAEPARGGASNHRKVHPEEGVTVTTAQARPGSPSHKLESLKLDSSKPSRPGTGASESTRPGTSEWGSTRPGTSDWASPRPGTSASSNRPMSKGSLGPVAHLNGTTAEYRSPRPIPLQPRPTAGPRYAADAGSSPRPAVGSSPRPAASPRPPQAQPPRMY